MKTPHKHAALIKAWADGHEVEIYKHGEWHLILNPLWVSESAEYRIKPEPKPDIVRYGTVWHASHCWGCDVAEADDNLKLTFDGETGWLKSAEVILTKEREALKLALAALERYETKRQDDRFSEIITAIKEALVQPSNSVEKPIDFELAYGEIYKDQRAALAEALAQPSDSVEQEPLAWVTQVGTLVQVGMTNLKTGLMYGWTPLYTTPPQREWVGLTDEQIEQRIGYRLPAYGFDAIRQLIKENT